MPTTNAPNSLIELDGVDIWLVPIAQPLSIQRHLAQLLTLHEHNQLMKYKIPRVATQYLISHSVRRSILSYYLGVAPTKIQFSQEGNGKPVLAGIYRDYEIAFNISHTCDLLIMAVAADKSIGIDAEKPSLRGLSPSFIESILSPAEQAIFDRARPREKPTCLMTMWTLKEALLKAEGIGLFQHPVTVDTTQILIPSEASKYIVCRQFNREWNYHPVKTIKHHICSLITGRRHIGYQTWFWDWNSARCAKHRCLGSVDEFPVHSRPDGGMR